MQSTVQCVMRSGRHALDVGLDFGHPAPMHATPCSCIKVPGQICHGDPRGHNTMPAGHKLDVLRRDVCTFIIFRVAIGSCYNLRLDSTFLITGQ